MSQGDRITAGIKAFARPYKLEKCVDALIDAGITNIRIGYDGPPSLKKKHMELLENKDANIDIKEFSFNSGLARVRNYLVDDLETEYFLLLDDDQYVPENILESLDILDVMNSIEGIGFPWILKGRLSDLYAKVKKMLNAPCSLETGNFYHFPRTKVINLENTNIPVTKDEVFILNAIENIKIATVNNHKYALPFEYIPNSAIFRSSLFDKIRWDCNFIIGGEHQDFFYRASRLGLKFGVSLDMFIIHDLGRDNKIRFNYEDYRYGRMEKESNKYLLQKHNLWRFECDMMSTQLFRLRDFRKYIPR